ncbi:MAG: glycine cleavage system protein GcvH [Spirochaetes bacterium]|nr:glycine cleavage system protein GcvH [Spirochaetota bacterium]
MSQNDLSKLLYSKSHEWVKIDGNKALIGITDYAQQKLGDIVFVEISEPGKNLEIEESLGNIESVKAVSELYSPLSGVILRINDSLADLPETINKDPYADGWIVELEIKNMDDLDKLMDYSAYSDYIKDL